jgi:hypothetical protein
MAPLLSQVMRDSFDLGNSALDVKTENDMGEGTNSCLNGYGSNGHIGYNDHLSGHKPNGHPNGYEILPLSERH